MGRGGCTLQALRWLFFTVILLAGLYPVMPVSADEIRPAQLDIKQQNTGLIAVTWKVPTCGDRMLAIAAQLPASLELLGSPTVQHLPGARIEHATYRNNGESLTGQRIVIDGLTAVQTDVLLLIQLRDGTSHSAILRPASPEFTIPLQAMDINSLVFDPGANLPEEGDLMSLMKSNVTAIEKDYREQ